MSKFTDFTSKNKKPYQYIPIPIVDDIDLDEEEIVEQVKIVPEKITVDIPKIDIVEDVNEKEEFSDLELSSLELLEIKKHALKDILEEELSVSELIDLVLLAKTGKNVKQKNFEPLVIREYLDVSGKITKNGRMYLEFDEVKSRLRTLIK